MVGVSPLLRREPRKSPADHLVTLIGKPDCHLCEEARAVVLGLAEELGFTWEELDINQDAELHRKYWEQIPVTLIDGRQHDFWKVDETRLRRALGG
ncbi:MULTISPECIES: glutaredoxin family protein [Streptacidiphilus]|uniref:Glutaredoxin family protein n=2 Tax=Streptacidiphilus TaxID=228398 RepID=A0ABV6UFS8_9ACTN|nr:glutaredoxin family protein [Streptacidiphilus jeojiense]